MQTPTKIHTPIEIRTPFPMRVKDHGLTLVHDMTGKERNWLHEVSVRDSDTQAINYLVDAGYSERNGWRKDGTQWWVWSKTYPLEWRDGNRPPPAQSPPRTWGGFFVRFRLTRCVMLRHNVVGGSRRLRRSKTQRSRTEMLWSVFFRFDRFALDGRSYVAAHLAVRF